MSEAPPCQNLLFQFRGRLLEFFPISKQVSGLWKPSFLQFGNALGMLLFDSVPLVSPPVFLPNFHVLVTCGQKTGLCWALLT